MHSTSNSNTQRLSLKGKSNLFDCENVLKNIVNQTLPIRLSLPNVDRKIFLKDLRTIAIILASSYNSRVVCEWGHSVSAKNQISLVELAAAIYGVPPAIDQSYRSVDRVKQELAQRNDILEDPPGVGETLTICAVDQSTRERPLALPSRFDKSEFITEFSNLVTRYFDRGTSQGFLTRIGPSLFDEGYSKSDLIFSFVFELYQNTFNHGCLNKEQNVIPGLRLIRLRKRVGHTKNRGNFIRGASGFSELENYFEETVPQKGSFKFYEISISDSGLGILRRFRSARVADNEPTSQRENLNLLNRIIDESLSSYSRRSGSGEGGLKNALTVVDSVRGFVSLRCDNLWVCRNATDSNEASEGEWLKPVNGTGDLATIPGTHFSLILPAS